METKIKFPGYLAGLLLFLSFLLPIQAKAQYEDVSLETFYEELSPYGVWIDDPQYGHVWRPDVDQDDFRPYYSNGHWEMTRYGNTWVSDYDWGWAPFHYGRWHYSNRRGWLWIPDTKWGPAWVSWRSGGGYYGWAPLGPGININIRIGPRIPDHYWVFIPQRSIYYSRYPDYNRRRNLNIYHNTIIINNTYVYNRNRYYTGPRADEIRRITREPVRIHEVRNQRSNSYGNNSNNRPEVVRDRTNSPRPERPDNRGVVSGRDSRTISGNATRPESVRTESSNRTPASGQRSGRSYDNQDQRNNQAERQVITERQEQSRQTPAAREQRPSRVQQAPRQAPERIQNNSPRQVITERQDQGRQSAPSREQRPARTQQAQTPRQAPERIQSSSPRQAPQSRPNIQDRSSSSSERSSGSSGNRPSRGN